MQFTQVSCKGQKARGKRVEICRDTWKMSITKGFTGFCVSSTGSLETDSEIKSHMQNVY